jgi:hypothetical protein
MNKYLYIGVSGTWDTQTTSVIAEAEDWQEALLKLYDYNGGRINKEIFTKAISGMEVDDAIVFMQEVISDEIKYFGVVDDAIYDKLYRA